MRKSNILYLIWILGTIGAIYAIVHYGNRLRAPEALPKLWALKIQTRCPLFPENESAMSLKQSGETLELLLLQVPPLSLHGKLKRDGSFNFSGEPHGTSPLGCRKGKMSWQGKANRESIEGVLRVEGEHCGVCPQPILITGRPQAPEQEER